MTELAINGGKPVRTKPFPTWPLWGDLERKKVIEAIDSGNWGYPTWECVPLFEKDFAAYHDAEHGICFNSGTSALSGALWAAGVKPGDDVILPAYTFIAPASAVILAGARPVFADIERDSFNLNPQSVEDHFTPNTKAVITVHLGGRPSDMSRLSSVCENHNAVLIEDAAQAWGAEWQNERVGALGDAGVFSFQSSKNLTSGEGGILLTNSESVAEYARSFCNCGRIEGKPRYEHYFIGGNYRLSEVQGAILMAQFENYPQNLKIRQENAKILETGLGEIEGIVPVNGDKNVTSNSYHKFLLRYKKDHFEEKSKNTIIEALQAEGIPAHPGYTLPLYKQPVFIKGTFGACGIADKTTTDYGNLHLRETETACSEEAVWISQNVLLGTKKDMQDVIDSFQKVKENINELKQ